MAQSPSARDVEEARLVWKTEALINDLNKKGLLHPLLDAAKGIVSESLGISASKIRAAAAAAVEEQHSAGTKRADLSDDAAVADAMKRLNITTSTACSKPATVEAMREVTLQALEEDMRRGPKIYPPISAEDDRPRGPPPGAVPVVKAPAVVIELDLDSD
jgi:hypothetical protein